MKTADSSRVICWVLVVVVVVVQTSFREALLADFVVLIIFGIESGLFAG